MIEYHVSEAFYSKPTRNLMGLVIEEAVYAPFVEKYEPFHTNADLLRLHPRSTA